MTSDGKPADGDAGWAENCARRPGGRPGPAQSHPVGRMGRVNTMSEWRQTFGVGRRIGRQLFGSNADGPAEYPGAEAFEFDDRGRPWYLRTDASGRGMIGPVQVSLATVVEAAPAMRGFVEQEQERAGRAAWARAARRVLCPECRGAPGPCERCENGGTVASEKGGDNAVDA